MSSEAASKKDGSDEILQLHLACLLRVGILRKGLPSEERGLLVAHLIYLRTRIASTMSAVLPRRWDVTVVGILG